MPGIETVFSSGPPARWRITARHTSAELRGYLDGDVGDLELLATALKPLGWVVIASPARPCTAAARRRPGSTRPPR